MKKICQMIAIAVGAACASGTVVADPIKATFRGVDTGSTFSVQFDDMYPTVYGFEGGFSSKDIHWNINDNLGLYRGDEWAVVTAGSAPKYDEFYAFSSVNMFGGLYVDVMYSGTKVHVAINGVLDRTEVLSLHHPDLNVDASQPGWARELFARASNVDFVATQWLRFQLDGPGFAESTEGPLRLQDIWPDGSFEVPYDDVMQALALQYPQLGKHTETMRLVSYTSVVPEPDATLLAFCGSLLAAASGGLARQRRKHREIAK